MLLGAVLLHLAAAVSESAGVDTTKGAPGLGAKGFDVSRYVSIHGASRSRALDDLLDPRAHNIVSNNHAAEHASGSDTSADSASSLSASEFERFMDDRERVAEIWDLDDLRGTADGRRSSGVRRVPVAVEVAVEDAVPAAKYAYPRPGPAACADFGGACVACDTGNDLAACARACPRGPVAASDERKGGLCDGGGHERWSEDHMWDGEDSHPAALCCLVAPPARSPALDDVFFEHYSRNAEAHASIRLHLLGFTSSQFLALGAGLYVRARARTAAFDPLARRAPAFPADFGKKLFFQWHGSGPEIGVVTSGGLTAATARLGLAREAKIAERNRLFARFDLLVRLRSLAPTAESAGPDLAEGRSGCKRAMARVADGALGDAVGAECVDGCHLPQADFRALVADGCIEDAVFTERAGLGDSLRLVAAQRPHQVVETVQPEVVKNCYHWSCRPPLQRP